MYNHTDLIVEQVIGIYFNLYSKDMTYYRINGH